MIPASAQLNWFGAAGSGRSAAPRSSIARIGSTLHGLSSGDDHAARASRAPGLSTRRVSRSAVSGSAISM